MKIKGVVLAGGTGSRLGELTKVTNKHLLPVAYQPMIYYPIKKLVGARIEDIMVVSGTEHMGAFISLLGSGRNLGCNLTYRVQDEAGGIAQALALAEDFVSGDIAMVLLGDNIFQDPLNVVFDRSTEELSKKAHIALAHVQDAHNFGVATLYNSDGKECIIDIVEKPHSPTSNWAVAGMYAYPPDVFDVIRTLKPSKRGELEITDVNKHYLLNYRLDYSFLTGYWTDAGTISTLNRATNLVQSLGVKY